MTDTENKTSRKLDEYRKLAVLHGKATEQGDSKTANRTHDALQNVFLEMVANGSGHTLLGLFDDKDPWVQLWSATNSLKHNTEAAAEKLKGLSAQSLPLVSMSAKYTLQSWSDGDLRL